MSYRGAKMAASEEVEVQWDDDQHYSDDSHYKSGSKDDVGLGEKPDCFGTGNGITNGCENGYDGGNDRDYRHNNGDFNNEEDDRNNNRENKKRNFRNDNGFGNNRGGMSRGGRRGPGNSDGRPNFRKDHGDGGDGESEKPREFYIPPEPTDNEEEIFNSGILSGINFNKYDSIPVKISGENVPKSMESFGESGLRELVLENVCKSGYTVPTPIQKAAIPTILQGRDLMACAQTGSGKTAAFLLPIINGIVENNFPLSIGKPHALIVSPTRELAIQIFNEARKFALHSVIKVSIVYGGTSSKYQGECIGKGCHILICTPGRLMDFVQRGFISFEEVRYMVLDEADRMLEMGFRETVEEIVNHTTMRSEHQSLMFSATFPEEIQRLAGQFLHNYVFIAVGVVGSACTDVKQTIVEVKKFAKRNKLMDILNESDESGIIIFVETKRGADFLASVLSENDIPTTSIHGDRLQRQREMALADFKTGKMRVLIATSVAARGLDIKNVNHVINFDLPKNIADYVHRIGRTGRVGNSGKATSFYDPDGDADLASDLVNILEGADQEVPSFLLGGGSTAYIRDSSSSNRFGARDVRRNVKHTDENFSTDGPAHLEEIETWD